MVGPFVFVDQYGPAYLPAGDGVDVRPHPHIGISTLSWLFEGAIVHRDSLGSCETVCPGGAYLMTAGKGIVHSERSPQSERDAGPAMYGMQTWLALPDAMEEMDPAWEVTRDLPLIEDNGTTAQVIMGSLWGKQSPATSHAQTIYAEINLAPGGSIPIDPEAEERGVMLVGGDASIDGTDLALHDLLILAPGTTMQLTSRSGGKIMLLGGEAYTSRRYVWWNLVSSSIERIEQAKRDWVEGRFPEVPGDNEEFIPLPKNRPMPE
jgi:redox-sensitive bicupin YhaK (pirin superfamily)